MRRVGCAVLAIIGAVAFAAGAFLAANYPQED